MTWTPDPEANAILERLTVGIRQVLGSHLLGVYLYGSTVTGDFDPRLSDLDVLAVVDADVDDTAFGALHALHDDIARTFPAWEGRVETHYIDDAAMRDRGTHGHDMIVISPGEPFHRLPVRRDYLVNWYVAREQGITLYGAESRTTIPPISQADFLLVVREHLHQWPRWARTIDMRRPALAYAVLTVCRAMYTLTLGEQTSKRRAALWVRTQLPEWAPLIDHALDWRERWREENDVLDEEAYEEMVRFVGVVSQRILGTD